MTDWVSLLYNDFLLRDVLGYVVPGGLVLATTLYALLGPGTLDKLRKAEFPRGAPIWVVAFFSAYLTGHAVAGFTFNLVTPTLSSLISPTVRFDRTLPSQPTSLAGRPQTSRKTRGANASVLRFWFTLREWALRQH